MAIQTNSFYRTINFTARPDVGGELLGPKLLVHGVRHALYQVLVEYVEQFADQAANGVPHTKTLQALVTAYRADSGGRPLGASFVLDHYLPAADYQVIEGAELLHEIAGGILATFPEEVATRGDVAQLLAFLGLAS